MKPWVAFVISTVLLIGNTSAQFSYPRPDSDTGFRVGDTIVVSWTSSNTRPYLELYGGYNEKRMLYRCL